MRLPLRVAVRCRLQCGIVDPVGGVFSDRLRAATDALLAQIPDSNLSVQVTGLPALMDTILATVESDMVRGTRAAALGERRPCSGPAVFERAQVTMDLVVLPLAAGVLLCLLRSFRLMLIPALSIGVSAVGGFGTAYLVTFTADVRVSAVDACAVCWMHSAQWAYFGSVREHCLLFC